MNVKDFKMIHYDPFDKQFLAYLVVDYDNIYDYQKEMERLTDLGIDEYEGIFGVTGFDYYQLVAMYADSSTEEDPVVKVGKYEVRINDVDPQNATSLEMFALLSYMDDKGLTDNHGMSSYSKMKAYSSQAEYNGFVNGLEDENLVWSEKRDWISILNNAKETFLNIPETYRQALNIDKMVFSLLEKRVK